MIMLRRTHERRLSDIYDSLFRIYETMSRRDDNPFMAEEARLYLLLTSLYERTPNLRKRRESELLKS
jgi:hypothetical protein